MSQLSQRRLLLKEAFCGGVMLTAVSCRLLVIHRAWAVYGISNRSPVFGELLPCVLVDVDPLL